MCSTMTTGTENTSREVDEINVKYMNRAALFAGLLSLCAWISLPVADIAFTLQSFGVLLALGVLGGKWGSGAIFIYLLLGAAGLPVFSGFQGGLGVLLGVTGGYLWGFLLGALVYRLLEKQNTALAMTAVLLTCYLCGSLWFSFWAGIGSLPLILLRCVVPYLIPDALKLLLALRLSRRLKRFL